MRGKDLHLFGGVIKFDKCIHGSISSTAGTPIFMTTVDTQDWKISMGRGLHLRRRKSKVELLTQPCVSWDLGDHVLASPRTMGPPQMNTKLGTPVLESPRTMGLLPDEYKIRGTCSWITAHGDPAPRWIQDFVPSFSAGVHFFDTGMSTFLVIEDLEYRGLRARGMKRMYATRLRKPQGVNKMGHKHRSKIGGSGYHNPPPQTFSDSSSNSDTTESASSPAKRTKPWVEE